MDLPKTANELDLKFASLLKLPHKQIVSDLKKLTKMTNETWYGDKKGIFKEVKKPKLVEVQHVKNGNLQIRVFYKASTHPKTLLTSPSLACKKIGYKLRKVSDTYISKPKISDIFEQASMVRKSSGLIIMLLNPRKGPYTGLGFEIVVKKSQYFKLLGPELKVKERKIAIDKSLKKVIKYLPM